MLEGNGETISDWIDAVLLLKQLGFNTFIFDYAGFGASTGKPTVEELDKDARAAWKTFVGLSPANQERIALGHSLGSAVLLSSVSDFHPAPDKIILHAPFSSAREIAIHLGTASPSWAWIIPDLWNNKSNIKKIKLPVCVVHSQSDEKTPYEMGQAVAMQSPSVNLVVLNNYRHNDLFESPDSTLWMRIIQCR